MRRYLLIGLSLLAPLFAADSAQAIVVNDGGTEAGVALEPAARGAALPAGVSAVTSTGSCTDPWLSSDLGGPNLSNFGLCYHGGSVIHKNETFALTWDAQRGYWSGTRGYVEQFMKDVADSSGQLGNPYAVTAQYSDGGGHAQYASAFGGGCIDFGATGGANCEFESNAGPGHDYPASGCTTAGNSFTDPKAITPNVICLTDAQIQSELSTMITQTGMLGRTQPGYTPIVNVLLPPGVDSCLDASARLCSITHNLTPPPPAITTGGTTGSIQAGNYEVEITYVTTSGEDLPSARVLVPVSGTGSTMTIPSPPSAPTAIGWRVYVTGPDNTNFTLQGATRPIGSDVTLGSLTTSGTPPPEAPFVCSYHSQVNVGGTEVTYVVQPWSAGTACDEPSPPGLPQDPTPQQLATWAGQRLTSPLSQSQISAIVDPAFGGWFGLDGTEMDDNGPYDPVAGVKVPCAPLPRALDQFSIGSSSQNPYWIQREFNNAAVIESDPNTYGGCAPVVILSPAFVVPSAVNPGDEVQLDGSATASTLIVPKADYHWDFGDGTSAVGPSVVHSYSKGGAYTVTLTVTDRGGNTATLNQTITVLGANGQPVTTTVNPSNPGLHVRILLMPQSLKMLLHHGVMMRVTSNARANGIAYVSIPRALAKRAHIKAGRKPYVVIGVGTLSGINDGTVNLHLKLSRSVVAKLRHLKHVTLSVRLSLVGDGGNHVAVDAAGRY